MNPWLRILRPGNGAISLVGTIVGGLAAVGLLQGPRATDLVLLALAGVTTFLVTSAGNVLNDYLDREGDKVNHPDRPIVRGEIGAPRAKTYATLLFLAAWGPALLDELLPGAPSAPLARAAPLLIVAAAEGILLLYELRWKAVGLPGNVCVAVLTGLVFLYGATVVGLPTLALPLAGMATLATLSREVIKDMEDMAGDVGRATFPQVHGTRAASAVARLAVGLALALSAVPLLTWLGPTSLAGLAYAAGVLAADAVFVLSVKDLPRRLHGAQRHSKLAMVLALAGFLGAALR